jgi:uncharacterized membrane protein YgdD (TMEM256/DUF423 family)
MTDRNDLPRPAALALALGGVLGAWGVASAAWAAHGAPDPRVQSLVETASRLLLVHAVALAALAALSGRVGSRGLALATLLIGPGALVFAGAVHVSALGGPRWLAATAPWGGTAMIAGWLVLAAVAVRAAARGPR